MSVSVYKAEYREAPTAHNPHGEVKWDVVDPWLRAVNMVGGMELLSRVLGIHKLSLRARRRSLGLPPLPSGRIPERVLTEHERVVQKMMNEGYSYGQMAAKLGCGKNLIQARVTRVKEKEKLQAMYCTKCQGLGLEECIGCSQSNNKAQPSFSGAHFHVCSECHGKSVYMPEPR